MSEKNLNILPIGALKRRNTKELLLGTQSNNCKVRREVSNEYQLDKRSLNQQRTQDLTGRQQESDQTNENDFQEGNNSEEDITNEPHKKKKILQNQQQKEREKSLEKMKVDFSQFLNHQKKSKDQKNGAFDGMLKKYLIDKEQQRNQQYENQFDANTSEANKKYDDEGNEIIEIIEESKEQKNKKRIMDMKIDEAVRLDLGEVKSKRKKEVDENLNQKLENSILEDNSITEDVRKIKLSNLHHQMLVERVRTIIQKTKKRNSDGENASNHIFENTMAIFKGLDTFIETKSFWQHLNSAEGKQQYTKGIAMKNGSLTARRVSKINDVNPSKQFDNFPQTSRVQNGESEKEIPSVIAKSRKYLDQNIDKLAFSEKKIGGQFLQGLEMQFMGEIKQILNQQTTNKNEDSNTEQQPAHRIPLKIDSEEEPFFNQLQEQILTGEFHKKQKKEIRKGQQEQEEHYNQSNMNYLDEDGFRNTAAFQMTQFEEKVKKGDHMLLVKSKNILKEKFHKLDLANHLAKQQRVIEMQQQHLHIKNLWERMSHSQKRSQKMSQSEQEQNQSSAQNSLLQKGDTSQNTEMNKTFLVSPNIVSKYASDFPSVSSKELPKITSLKNISASDINSFHKVKQVESQNPCVFSSTISSKVAKDMNKRKPDFSPGNRMQISNSEKCFCTPEIKNSRSPEFIDKFSGNIIQKKNSHSFITQEQYGVAHPIIPHITEKKDKNLETTTNLDIYKKTQLKNITPIRHNTFGKEALFQSASTSKIEQVTIKNRQEVPESIFRSTRKQQMKISSLSPSQCRKRCQDQLGQSPQKKLIHLNLNKPDYSPCRQPTRNNLNFNNNNNLLPSISSTSQVIQSAKQNQTGRKQFGQEVINLQEDLFKTISSFKRQYREDKVIFTEQIKQIQSEIDSVNSKQSPEQLDSLRM